MTSWLLLCLPQKNIQILICDMIAADLLGTDLPDLPLESALPSLPQRSIWHRFDIDFLSWPYCDAKSTPEEERVKRIRHRWGPGALCA